MNHFRKHIPNCVDISTSPPEFEFDTIEDFCSKCQPLFKRFDVTPNSLRKSQNLVLWVNDEKHWVLGYIKEDIPEMKEWK